MTTPPEAKNEYSRAPGGSRAVRGPSGASRLGGLPRVQAAVLAGGCLGALLLVVAEFLTLYTLHVSSSLSPIASTTTGAHNSYALIPLGLLSALMALASRGLRNPAALIALTGLGVVALLIALLGDLPDAHAHGITGHLQLATTSAGEGLYVETLGGFLLLVTGGMALLAGAPTFRFPSVPRPSRRNPRRARSES